MATLTGSGPPDARSGTSRVLRRPNFLRLWVGAITSAAGTAVGSIIITWLVYASTHSPIAISILGVAQFLPTLFFGLFAGALIDRLDRRRLMLTCDVSRALLCALLAVFVLVYGPNTVVLIVIVFVVATFSTVFRPATNASIPRILGPAEVTEGNGLLQGGTTIAQFIGSPIGGLLLVTIGSVAGLALNALTYAISATMIFLMAIPAVTRVSLPTGTPRASILSDVGAGLRYLRSQQALFLITMSAMGANFFLSIWGGFLVIYVADQLHQGAAGFGLLIAANTAGFALGAVLPGRLHTDLAPGRWVLASWGLVGFFILGLAATSSLVVAIALTVVSGTLLSIGNTTWLSGVQRTVPDEFLGRFFATDEAGSYAMIPAGVIAGGVLILLFGVAWTYAIAGVGALAVNIVLFLSPSVWDWGRNGKSTVIATAPVPPTGD
jgi:predicted MFS family arabinose efflux permease